GARLAVRDATRREARRAHEADVAVRAALSRFAAAIAHKINNPLQGLVVRLELLEEDCAEGGADPDLIEKIAEGVARIQGVVRDLPTLQRNHEPAPEEAGAPLHKVLAETLALVEDPAAHRRVALVLDAPGEVPPSSVPAAVVRDIMTALLLNAVRAARPGGEVELTVLADGDGGTLVVVHDDAPAIDEGRLGHVFDPFTGCEAGRGDDCGLFVAFLLARRYGARLAVSSCAGRGNTFKLLLPSA
ncbi:MAG TPA: HAMP domain-containing sensor histidine kinase, partial [Acidobacteriota bacterium]|nr:HAMP domain-containing sensor histidine kinase [Acidobacteriota bacterium]